MRQLTKKAQRQQTSFSLALSLYSYLYNETKKTNTS